MSQTDQEKGLWQDNLKRAYEERINKIVNQLDENCEPVGRRS